MRMLALLFLRGASWRDALATLYGSLPHRSRASVVRTSERSGTQLRPAWTTTCHGLPQQPSLCAIPGAVQAECPDRRPADRHPSLQHDEVAGPLEVITPAVVARMEQRDDHSREG